MARIKNIDRVKSTPSTSTINTFKVGKEEKPKKFSEEEKMDIISSAKELDFPDTPREEKTSEGLLEKVDPNSIDKTSKTTYKAPPVYRVPVSPKKNPFAKKVAKYTDKQEIGPLRSMNVPEGRVGMFNMWCDYLEDMKYTWTKEDAKKWPKFPVPKEDGKIEYIEYKVGEKIPYASKYFITSRGTGKSKNSTLRLLWKVYTDDDYYATLLMRNWSDHLKLTRNYYEGCIDEFIEYNFGKEAVEERLKWDLRDNERKNWDSYYRAVQFKGRERIFFINLFHPSESKKANKPHEEIFYEEAIPTKEQRAKHELTTKGWLPNEETNYSMIFRSCDRDTGKTKKVFLGNPTVPWVEIWFLTKHWWEELKEFNRWYWGERVRVNTLEKWMKWAWKKIYKKVLPGIGPVYLHLEKNHHKVDEFDSEDNWNWDFFAKRIEEFHLLEKFIKGSTPMWMFQGFICYYAKKGFYFFINKNDIEISNQDEIIDIPERYINHEQYLASRQKYKEKMPKESLMAELLSWWDQGIIKFKGMDARDMIMEFMIRQPVRITNPFISLNRLTS